MLASEQFWIDWTDACKLGYNQRRQAQSNLGLKWTNEHKAKISASKRGTIQDRVMVEQRNLNLRKLEKWPHTFGCRCKCRECLDKANEIKNSRRIPKERMRYRTITEAAPTLDIIEPKVKKK